MVWWVLVGLVVVVPFKRRMRGRNRAGYSPRRLHPLTCDHRVTTVGSGRKLPFVHLITSLMLLLLRGCAGAVTVGLVVLLLHHGFSSYHRLVVCRDFDATDAGSSGRRRLGYRTARRPACGVALPRSPDATVYDVRPRHLLLLLRRTCSRVADLRTRRTSARLAWPG